jgi:hypothetical protein
MMMSFFILPAYSITDGAVPQRIRFWKSGCFFGLLGIIGQSYCPARLEMGRYTNASRAPRRMNPGSLRHFQHARAKLQLLDKKDVAKWMNPNCRVGAPFIKQNEPPARMAQLFRQIPGQDALRLCRSPPPLVGQQTECADAE